MWNNKKINNWCWSFIVKNKRVPILKDLDNKNSPDINFIVKTFGSLEKLIDECGPISYTQSILNNGNSFANLKKGFLRFYNEYGNYPSALQIDKYPYLPSSRTIQRSWGGLETFRKAIGLEITNYSKGKIRSEKSAFIGIRGFSEENKLEIILQKHFGEVFVHSQKRIGPVRADFFIYTPKGNFAVDIFCFEDKNCFNSDINIKLKTYKNYPYPVIYLPVNQLYTSKDINNWITNKKNIIPNNQKVFHYDDFLNWIKTIQTYPKLSVKINKFIL